MIICLLPNFDIVANSPSDVPANSDDDNEDRQDSAGEIKPRAILHCYRCFSMGDATLLRSCLTGDNVVESPLDPPM
jgi:hypothetical protein